MCESEWLAGFVRVVKARLETCWDTSLAVCGCDFFH